MISSKQFLATLLCCLLCVLPALGEPQAAAQRAGQITALIPAAERNAQPVKAKDAIYWNDLLSTQHAGRVRAGLTDGSILSIGSDSELRVVQHDAASQQTSLEVNFGAVRSQVQKITKPGGKFQITTPNAVIGVIGTDLYVAFNSNKTTVICYQGTVSVTPTTNAQAVNNTGSAANNIITVVAGQMVEITSEIPPAGFHAIDTPPATSQASELATSFPPSLPKAGSGHTGIWITVGVVAAAGLATGLVLATRGGKGPTGCQKNPSSC